MSIINIMDNQSVDIDDDDEEEEEESTAESPLLPGQEMTLCRPRRSSALSINLQNRKQQLAAAIESFTVDDTTIPSTHGDKMDPSKVGDAVGKVTGDWGKWQLRTVLLIFLCKIPSSWFMACIIFTAPAPRHGEFYCKPPDTIPHQNHTYWIKISHPEKEDQYDEEFTIDFCNIYEDAQDHVLQYLNLHHGTNGNNNDNKMLSKEHQAEVYSHKLDGSAAASASTITSLSLDEASSLPKPWIKPRNNTNNNKVVPCTEFKHQTNYHSIITQYDLVCSRDILVAVTQFFHLFGVLTGGILATQLLKYFSPRNVMMFGMLSQIFCGNMTGHVISYELHVFFRCLSAVCCAQMYTAGAMIFMDITGGKHRTIVITLFEQFWSIGVILLPGVASLFSSWSHLYMAISFPTFILIYLWRWIPDSPRWMITRGRVDEAKEILMQCIECNGTKHGLPSDIDHQLQLQAIACMESPPPAGWLSLWSGSLKSIRHIICVHLCWSIYIVIYYGMLLNIRSFSRDHLEINTAVAGCCEIIGVFIGLYLILNTTKKWLWTGLFNIVAGFICYLAWIIPPEVKGNNRVALLMLSAMISKSAISSTLAILTTCTTELVPEEKKRICAFSTIVWARIWLLCAPFIGATVIFGQLIPQTAFASLAIIGGVLTTLISSPRTIPKRKKTDSPTTTTTNLPPELMPGIWTTKTHNDIKINRI